MGGRNCSSGGDMEVKMAWNNSSPVGSSTAYDSAGSPGTSMGSLATGFRHASGPVRRKVLSPSLSALLKQTTIKEHVIHHAIERLGGGETGVEELVKMIMFWAQAKDDYQNVSPGCSDRPFVRSDDLSQNGDFLSIGNGPSLAQESNISLPVLKMEQRSSSDGGIESMDDQFGAFFNCIPVLSEDLTGSTDFRSGPSSDCPSWGNEAQISTGEPVTLGLLDDDQILGGGLELKGPFSNVPDVFRMPTRLPRGIIRKFPDVDEDNHIQKKKVGYAASSPAASFSSQGSTDFYAATSTSSTALPPVSEVSSNPDVFGSVGAADAFHPTGTLSLGPGSSPAIDSQALDMMSFCTFSMQNPPPIDENLTVGGSFHGCSLIERFGSFGSSHQLSTENSLDCELPGARHGAQRSSKPTPTATKRLARKNRMVDRNKNKKSASRKKCLSNSAASPAGISLIASATSLQRPTLAQLNASSGGNEHKVKDRTGEEHLQFLLQKSLKPTDVGNLGRIIVPKKEAEKHLPPLDLDHKTGILIAFEDYDTGETVELRFRFWPNIRSRMYLLENTGEFVRSRRLQEGDRILIYKNEKQGTYIIRARKAHDCVDAGPVEGQGPLIGGVVKVENDHEEDELNLADLPDAPMGDGSGDLVRFPSLGSFDGAFLDLAGISAVMDDVNSSFCPTKVENAN